MTQMVTVLTFFVSQLNLLCIYYNHKYIYFFLLNLLLHFKKKLSFLYNGPAMLLYQFVCVTYIPFTFI